MDIKTILTELVVIANTLDERNLTDAAADLDAAIFILSSEDAQPLNKSLASLTREQYAAVRAQEHGDEELDAAAVTAVQDVMQLTDKILDLDPTLRVAVLQGLVHSMRSVLAPGKTLTETSINRGADLLAEAERKLVHKDEKSVGYMLGVIRSKLENSNG